MKVGSPSALLSSLVQFEYYLLFLSCLLLEKNYLAAPLKVDGVGSGTILAYPKSMFCFIF